EAEHNLADIFFFVVEGKVRYNRQRARLAIGTPGNHHTYFSKIEAGVTYPSQDDSTKAVELCKKLISEALPVLFADHFPTSQQIKRR
ncbi:MAG: hypothetical protein ACYSRZ_10055, partial [Planctomycetota bacterium]